LRLLNRFKRRPEPQWRPPSDQPIEVPEMDHELNVRLRVPSRSDPSLLFDANIFRLSCTCPNFSNKRSLFGPRDVRRICPHLYQAICDAGLDQNWPRLFSVIMQHGRRFFRFRRVTDRANQADIAFGFNGEEPHIGIFAVIGPLPTVAGYNVQDRMWIGDRPADHEAYLKQQIDKVFFPEND